MYGRNEGIPNLPSDIEGLVPSGDGTSSNGMAPPHIEQSSSMYRARLGGLGLRFDLPTIFAGGPSFASFANRSAQTRILGGSSQNSSTMSPASACTLRNLSRKPTRSMASRS
jgi:hypothetical protein